MRNFMNVVNDFILEDVSSAEPLTYSSNGMFDQWTNDSVALSGGWRSGNSPANYLRVAYTVVDVRDYLSNGKDAEAATYGITELYRNSNNQLAALINIKLDKSKRKNGMGGIVVKSLVTTYHDHFVIIDIRKMAIGFWRKMGCEFYTPNGTEITNPSKYDGRDIILGVIRKPGSTTPLSDLPAFYKKKAATL